MKFLQALFGSHGKRRVGRWTLPAKADAAADDKAAADKAAADKSEADKKAAEDAKKTAEDKKHTDADVDRIVKERLKRAEESANEKAAKERRDSEEKALAEQQRFKELSEKQTKTIGELEPRVGALTGELEQANKTIDALNEVIKADVAAEIKALNLPSATTELLEGKSALEQRAWLTKHKEELLKSKGQRPTGTPPTPTGDKGAGDNDQKAQERTASWYTSNA
ncbi:MAG: hypothetical protein WC655_21330 [Candidatus Hydrogenedentales bacterium]|jgi:hypothetical protein